MSQIYAFLFTRGSPQFSPLFHDTLYDGEQKARHAAQENYVKPKIR